jgi:hypothetical protein
MFLHPIVAVVVLLAKQCFAKEVAGCNHESAIIKLWVDQLHGAGIFRLELISV